MGDATLHMLPTNALLGSLGKKPAGKSAVPARAVRFTYTSTTAHYDSAKSS